MHTLTKEEETFEIWTQRMWRFSSPMTVHCEDKEAFKGFSHTWAIGDLSITYFSAPPYRAVQTETELSKAQRKRLVMTIPTEGRCDFSQFGRFVELRPGEAVFHVTKAPMIYNQYEHTTAWLIGIPLKAALMHVDDPEEICATLLNADSPGFCAVRRLLISLPDELPKLSHQARDIFAQTAISMTCAVISEMRGREDSKRSQTTRQRVRQIKGYVDLHLTDPDLTPSQIANEHTMSLRYLHLLFQTEETTIAHYIRNRRLDASVRFISQNANKRLDAENIAYRFGFSSTVQFRRSFARKYGTSPTQFLKLIRSEQ